MTGDDDQILLVEDDGHTRDWLAGMLARCEGVGAVQACATVAEAREWLGRHTPAIVLTDLGLPDGSGLEIIRLAARCADCEILVLTIFGDEAHVVAAIEAGARGYLLKDGSLHSVREHLACLRNGGSPLSPQIARTLVRRLRGGVPKAGPDGARRAVTPPTPDAERLPMAELGLSDRERAVLAGIGKGFTYAEVAIALGVTTNTVRTHVRHLYRKLAVNSGIEALYEYNRLLAESGRELVR